MQLITTTRLNQEQKERALGIWNAEYPAKLVMPGITEFDAFLETLVHPKYYLLYNNADGMAGWAATFFVNEVRCFFIMIDGSFHGKGCGTILLNELKINGNQLFGWAIDHDNDLKTNGHQYPSPIGFYKKNGFVINNELRLDNELLSAVNVLWNSNE